MQSLEVQRQRLAQMAARGFAPASAAQAGLKPTDPKQPSPRDQNDERGDSQGDKGGSHSKGDGDSQQGKGQERRDDSSENGAGVSKPPEASKTDARVRQHRDPMAVLSDAAGMQLGDVTDRAASALTASYSPRFDPK